MHTPHLKTDEDRVHEGVTHALERFAERLTRVDVFLKDENANKGGNDKRCILEARPRGLDPVAAEHLAAEALEAVQGAASKLKHLLEHRFGRLDERR